MNTKQMTFLDYADGQDWLANHFDEQYWENRSCDTELTFNLILEEAAKEGVIITDVDTVDYDRILYQWYNDTEKGLS